MTKKSMVEAGKKKSWFGRHWLLATIFTIGIVIISAFVNDSSNPKPKSTGLNILGGAENLSSTSTNLDSITPSSKYTTSEIEKMSLSKKLSLCTKDIAGDAIDIPEVKNEAYTSCYQIYYSGGEEALNEFIQGIK